MARTCVFTVLGATPSRRRSRAATVAGEQPEDVTFPPGEYAADRSAAAAGLSAPRGRGPPPRHRRPKLPICRASRSRHGGPPASRGRSAPVAPATASAASSSSGARGAPAGGECRGRTRGHGPRPTVQARRGDGAVEHVQRRPVRRGHVRSPGGHQHELAGAAEQLPGAAGQVGGEVGAAQVHGDAVREQHRGCGQPGRYPAGQGRAGEPQLRPGLGVAAQVGECRRAQRRAQRAEHRGGRVAPARRSSRSRQRSGCRSSSAP